MTDTGTTSMDAQIIGRDPPGVVVQVIDYREYTHHVLFDWDGNLIGHVHERYTEETQRDPKPAQILKRVQFRARNEAHRQTDATFLGSIIDTTVLEDAVTVIENLDLVQFVEHFNDFCEAVHEPPVNNVEFTTLFLSLNETRDELVGQSEPVTFYAKNNELIHTEFIFQREPDIYITIPSLDRVFACDKRFQNIIVHHIRCQIRDLYYMQGSEPPEEYRVEGWGINDPSVIPFNKQES